MEFSAEEKREMNTEVRRLVIIALTEREIVFLEEILPLIPDVLEATPSELIQVREIIEGILKKVKEKER